MSVNRKFINKKALAVACASALLLGQNWAHAVPGNAVEVRPKINLFPTSVVENLSNTSRAARDMENGLYEIVARLDKQKQAYERTGCTDSDDRGCVQLRKAVRGTYKEMLDLMQASIPEMRGSLDATVNSMGNSLRSEIGRKMTPGDVQRVLGGRSVSNTGLNRPVSSGARQGKLSKMFSRWMPF